MTIQVLLSLNLHRLDSAEAWNTMYDALYGNRRRGRTNHSDGCVDVDENSVGRSAWSIIRLTKSLKCPINYMHYKSLYIYLPSWRTGSFFFINIPLHPDHRVRFLTSMFIYISVNIYVSPCLALNLPTPFRWLLMAKRASSSSATAS